MPVFISYHRPDELRARSIYLYLTAQDVPAYLDVLDPELQGSEAVTQHILDALRRCTHLLALISNTTVNSWWVPFEIGVATESDRRISSFDKASVALPEYLRIWPILRNDDDLAKYVRRYKQDSLPLQKAGKMLEARTAYVQSAEQFHQLLKADLGQR
jgi:hypothetical protein